MEDEKTILVVDDEPALRDIFGGWVESLNCGKVLTAGDGQDALEILESTSITLLITDVRMPRMDGTELVRRLFALAKIPSIVFVSGFSDVNEREMYEFGAESFLTKPLRKEDLTRAVERALARRSELWMEPPLRPARQSILIGDPSGPSENYVRVGKGGFCAHYPDAIALGKVDFVCHLGDGDTTLRGSGTVRWRSRAEELVGIEFDYLDESSRAHVVDEIASSSRFSYIPSNVVKV